LPREARLKPPLELELMRVGCFDRNDKVVFAIVLCLATYVHNVMLRCSLLSDRTGNVASKERQNGISPRVRHWLSADRCAKTESRHY
jgi:hypothetical protein